MSRPPGIPAVPKGMHVPGQGASHTRVSPDRQVTSAAAPTSLVIKRPPKTDDELHAVVKTLWGIDIPRVQVCRGHRAPFEAFADAYFARYPVSVWKASRGFGGKSMTLATLGMTEAVLLRAEVNVLGGSSAQSLRVHEVMGESWGWPLSPQSLIRKQTTYQTQLMHGGQVRALMASQKSVRGPHPQRLRLDEVDEMEWDIFEASLGQPMSSRYITSQTVISSTHQYPDKTMSKVLERAKENGWPVYQWCYHETAEPHGWLRVSDIMRKKQEVSKVMWETEYELQEPSFEGRAIDPFWVDKTFDPNLGEFPGDEGKLYQFEAPQPEAIYVTAADWAKQRDWTIIRTFKIEPNGVWREVAFERLGRRPWPIMVGRLDHRLNNYPGLAVHDATGLGNVVSDYLEHNVTPVEMTGKVRTQVFSEYIAAIEGGKFHCPRVNWAYEEHKYVAMDDLFGRGHPPDSVVSGALAWWVRQRLNKKLVLAAPKSITQKSYWRR